jgi:acyl-CoA reductase-like NAD-dependent aldehyde dehydrogenase
MDWIEESKKDGAKVISGGAREGQVITPAILTGVQPEHKLYSEEVFGPVVVAQTYKDFPEAMMKVNDSRFGLQAGVFTQNAGLVQQAIQELDVGGIMINEVPTYRADNMPYGGTKESGLGREGVRYTMEEYCERKTVVHWNG